MTKSNNRFGCVITFHEEDGSSRDVSLSPDVYERMLAAWKHYELQRGEPACFHELIEHLAERVLADHGDAEAK